MNVSKERRPHGRRFLFAALLFLTSCATTAPAPPVRIEETFDTAKVAEIDAAIDKTIAGKRIPGGVLWMERDGVAYHRAYGNRALVPEVEPMTEDTIFDAASITKVVATAPSIWLLIQQGKVGLDDPLTKYLPEFRTSPEGAKAPASWRDEITVRHLLTHTSGLRPDITLTERFWGFDEVMRRIMAEDLRQQPGAVFRYSDINYELLGEIVRRASGEPLDVFSRKHVFLPLGMKDTRFRPFDPNLQFTGKAPVCGDCARIAPTEETAGEGMLRGVVHDPTARRMGGVAGHAGLFTTASDLATFARALLNGGGGVFTPETVKAMTSVQSPKGVAVRRAAGFDIDSGFARPRGEVFPLGSFGHTGWTGGIFWVDPFSKTFYVFTSNRVHPDGKGSVTGLQRQLGTLVAEAVKGFDFANVPGALPKRPGGGVRTMVGGADASNGIDVMVSKQYEPLRGLRIGLITNHTGIDRSGNPTIDLLRSAPGVELVSLFSPEHGIRGAADEKVADDRDEVTGLPIYSLYGERRKPAPEQLVNLDALVFDIQDVGARFYTYISTMALAMQAAAEAKIRFIVLDRVNPIGGLAVEGPILVGEFDFIGPHDITLRHGMTVGELAKMFQEEKKIAVDLQVIQVTGWKREMWQDEAGLPWINTSPNMRSLTEAGLYPGIGLLERAVSIGRGTPIPFELVGAPYIDGEVLKRELDALKLPGVAFEATRFTPDYSTHKGQECGGVKILLTDRKALRAVDTGIAVTLLLQRLYPEKFKLQDTAHLLRHPATLDAIRAGRSLEEVRALWDTEAFVARRAKYLLY